MRLFVLGGLYLVSLSLCIVIIHAAFRGADSTNTTVVANVSDADRVYDDVASGQGAMFIMVFVCVVASGTTAANFFWRNSDMRAPAIGFTVAAIEIALVGTTVMFVLDRTQPAWISLPIGADSVLASAVFLLILLVVALGIVIRGPKRPTHAPIDEMAMIPTPPDFSMGGDEENISI